MNQLPPALANAAAQNNVLFVGNLSFFCEEKHLFELFNQYGPVENVHIVRNDDHTRSLLFGFVTMTTAHAAREMHRLLNECMFMGRRMKVAISDKRIDGRSLGNPEGIQVYVSFCSFFAENEIIFPTEMFLRKAFIMHGKLLDCSVKDYKFHKEQKVQEGYGFLTLASFEEAQKLATECRNITVDGITITCSLTHHLKNGVRKPRGGATSHSPMPEMNPHMLPQHAAYPSLSTLPLSADYSASSLMPPSISSLALSSSLAPPHLPTSLSHSMASSASSLSSYPGLSMPPAPSTYGSGVDPRLPPSFSHFPAFSMN